MTCYIHSFKVVDMFSIFVHNTIIDMNWLDTLWIFVVILIVIQNRNENEAIVYTSDFIGNESNNFVNVND